MSKQDPPSNFGPDSKFAEQPEPEKIRLRRELLGVVLRSTLKKTGVPPQWLAGEVKVTVPPNGEPMFEVLFSLDFDEPRFLTYISSFQAEFQRRLVSIAPDAPEWIASITWLLNPDPTFELPMPTPEYWEMVRADRELAERQAGVTGWDQEALSRHFSDTNPGELVVDFDDTKPPERDVEDVAPPPPQKR